MVVIKWTADYYGKTAGSNTVNPHMFKRNIYANPPLSLPNPNNTTNIYESITSQYNTISSLNGVVDAQGTQTNGGYSTHLFTFNILTELERKLGTGVWGNKTSLAEKITKAKSIITGLYCTWYGYGSSVNGNKASMRGWMGGNAWSTGENSHTSSTVASLTYGGNTVSGIGSLIDNNGFSSFVLFGDPSNGTVASTITTDYVKLELTVDYTYEELQFSPTWMEQWQELDTTWQGAWSPIRTGGNQGYNSFLGTPLELIEALRTSKVKPKLLVSMYTETAGLVRIGGHRLVGRPSFQVIPWQSKDNKAQLSTSSGRNEYDITDAFVDDLLSGNYAGLAMYGAIGEPLTVHTGVLDSPNRIWYKVLGEWNSPPKAPKVLTPKFADIVDDKVLVTWEPSVDDDPISTLTYQVEISADGQKWTSYPKVDPGVTSYLINTIGLDEGNNYQVRVRAFDQDYASEYGYSPKFTIWHKNKPKAPTQLIPTNGDLIVRTLAQTIFTWEVNSNVVQQSYRWSWRYVYDDGTAGSWNTSDWYDTSNKYHSVETASTFPSAGWVEWTVQIKDIYNLESEWADGVVVNLVNTPSAPNITSPTSNQVLNVGTVTVRWTAPYQQQWKATLKKDDLIIATKEGTFERETYFDGLVSNSNYAVKIEAFINGVWTSTIYRLFSTNFSPPTTPVINEVFTAGDGVHQVNFTLSNTPLLIRKATLERRPVKLGYTYEWEIVDVMNYPPVDYNALLDFQPASGVTYEYRIKVYSNVNNSESISNVVQHSSEIFDATITDPFNQGILFSLRIVNSRNLNKEKDNEIQHFAGRPKPTREFGENETFKMELEWYSETWEEAQEIQEFLLSGKIFLYRDHLGRAYYMTTGEVTTKDEEVCGHTQKATLTEVDFKYQNFY